jgi:hypothetical protein
MKLKLLLSAITTLLLLAGQCWAQTATTKQASSAPSGTKETKGTGKKAEAAKRQEHGPTAGAAAPKRLGGAKTTHPTSATPRNPARPSLPHPATSNGGYVGGHAAQGHPGAKITIGKHGDEAGSPKAAPPKSKHGDEGGPAKKT